MWAGVRRGKGRLLSLKEEENTLPPHPKQDGEGQTGGRGRLGAMKAKTILPIAAKATVTSSSCISKEEL